MVRGSPKLAYTALVVVLVTLTVIPHACLAQLTTPQSDFETFKVRFNKDYLTSREKSNRYKIFYQNWQRIKAHNEEASRGLHTFTLGINKFADLTEEEYRSRNSGLKVPEGGWGIGSSSANMLRQSSDPLPDEVDWRKEGYVTPVKAQGECGSCWAFSSIGAVEGAFFNKTGKLIDLSEQNLVDCSRLNSGCDGGFMDKAFIYMIRNGIETEKSYPYTGVEAKCAFKPENVGANITSFIRIESGREDQLQLATATIGPVSAALDSSPFAFQFYAEGVMSSFRCSSTELDHAVVVVGYGKDPIGGEYWLAKNSWGPNWGDEGYIKIARNKDNMCGIATAAFVPIA